jgi:hypothetical protein
MSTNQFRRYLDLLNEAETSSTFRGTLVANEPVIPGQPLSQIQMSMVDLSRSMGNQIAPEVQQAYDLAKQAGIQPRSRDRDQSSLASGSDLIAPNTNVALPSSGTFSNDDAIANLNRQMSGGSVPRCAVCGTPQSQHQKLQHQFVAGGAADRPAPVPQGGGSTGDISRIKQLQRELSAAGANLGKTGANRNGIDGDIGPLTRAAMIKYPDISAKYADLSADPAAQASTPAVDTSKLTAALGAIEGILSKYKVKLGENRESSTRDQMKHWHALMELTQADMDAAAANRRTAQGANQSAIDARVAADAKAKKIGPYYSDTPAKAMPYSQAAQQASTAAKAEYGSLKAAAATAKTGT